MFVRYIRVSLYFQKKTGQLEVISFTLFQSHLGRTQKDVWQFVLEQDQRLVQIFENADDRVGHLHVGLGLLQNLERIEVLANEIVTAK